MLGDIPATSSSIEILNTGGVVRNYRERAQPGPLGSNTLRLLDLREAIRDRDIKDPKKICETALEIDRDLESWTSTLSPDWGYTTANATESPSSDYYDGKLHVYRSHWVAQIWINWRVHRILANQIILQNDTRNSAHHSGRISLIQNLSTDICISASTLIGSPRRCTLTDYENDFMQQGKTDGHSHGCRCFRSNTTTLRRGTGISEFYHPAMLGRAATSTDYFHDRDKTSRLVS